MWDIKDELVFTLLKEGFRYYLNHVGYKAGAIQLVLYEKYDEYYLNHVGYKEKQ